MFNKRCRLAALAGLACVARLAADGTGGDLVPAWGSMYAAGNTTLSGQVAVESDGGALVLSAAPSVEFIVWKPVMAGIAPLDLGVQAMGRVAVPLRYAGFQLGLGGGGSVHFGLRGLETPVSGYLDRVDLFARFGLGFAATTSDGPGLIGYSSSGFNYFVDDRLFIGLAYTQWGYYGGVSLQGGLRLGRGSSVSGMGGVWDAGALAIGAAAETVFVTRFYAYYFTSFYTGGYYFPAPYRVGDSTVYRVRDRDSGDSFTVERALLSEEADGSRWWRLEFRQGDESVLYEFRMRDDTRVAEILYSENGGPTVRVVPTRTDMAAYYEGATVYDGAEDGRSKKETVRVGAGRFDARRVSRRVVADDGSVGDFAWWLSDSVPGGLVKYEAEEEDDSMELTLERVSTGAAFRLRSAK